MQHVLGFTRFVMSCHGFPSSCGPQMPRYRFYDTRMSGIGPGRDHPHSAVSIQSCRDTEQGEPLRRSREDRSGDVRSRAS
jgi:hypothetical protein